MSRIEKQDTPKWATEVKPFHVANLKRMIDIVNAEIKLLSNDYFFEKLKENMGFKFFEGSTQIGTGRILKIINQKLKKDCR